jgi:hypothetical protein
MPVSFSTRFRKQTRCSEVDIWMVAGTCRCSGVDGDRRVVVFDRTPARWRLGQLRWSRATSSSVGSGHGYHKLASRCS